MKRRAVLALLTGPLAGCKLIDQRTFDPDAGKPPPAAVLPAPPAAPPPGRSGPQPLVVIPLAPPVDYDAPLHSAVAAALSRGRREFDVRTAVPNTGTPDAQGAATQSAGIVAARVARLIAAQGGRATLSAEADAGLTGSAVLVFVR